MRKLFLTLILLIIFSLVALVATIGFTLRNYSKAFFEAAQVDPKAFISMVREGWETPVDAPGGVVSFLVLGLDEVEGRNEQVLTDSMILVMIHLESDTVTMVSIPRDLWIDKYKTKINALYYYGIERYPENPERFPKEVIEEITGVPVQYVVLLSLDQVGGFIDAVGGVEVDVQRSFADALFPRQGVDVTTVRDPNILYEPVSFEKGIEHMYGDRALVFMRSRQSTDPIEGTDDARSRRQQQVISAVVAKLRTAITRLDLKTLGQAYSFYNTTYANVIDPRQLIALGRSLAQNGFTFSMTSHDITPLLMNPPESKYRQWVYEPIDPTWNALRQSLQASSSATIPR